jgi:serine/threonine protein kinase
METVEAEEAHTGEEQLIKSGDGGGPRTLYIQDGGALIGEGGYGCIFQPALICKGRTRPFKAGRLGKFTAKEDMANEIRAALHFKNEPAAKQYMILPYLDTLCSPKPVAQQKEKQLNQCEPMNRFGYSKMLQYEMDYGGTTLSGRMKTLNSKFAYDTFIRRMLEIGAYITLHGIVHNDLHDKNVLVNRYFVPRLIDFGRSILVKDIDPDMIKQLQGVVYNPRLGQIPPESSAQDGVNEGVSFSRILYDLQKQKVELLYAERYLGLSRARQMADFKAFWESSRAVQQGDWLNFLKTYWSVIDSWSIGGILLYMMRVLLSFKEFGESSAWKSIRSKVRTVLRGMMRASPRDRLDCVEALALYDPANDLVTGDIGRAWLDKREKTRARLG